MSLPRKVRVLIVDDSAIVRKMLSDALSSDPGIEVVGVAQDPFVARDMVLKLQPDVLTLDIEMPRMDGLTFLRKLMEHRPLPVIIVSSVTQAGSAASIDALAAGAIDVIAKPGGPQSVGQVAEKLKRRIRGLTPGQPIRLTAERSGIKPAPFAGAGGLATAKGLIVIGASTGGTQAIESVLTRLPPDSPPILVVQHMPAGFTRAFAERLSRRLTGFDPRSPIPDPRSKPDCVTTLPIPHPGPPQAFATDEHVVAAGDRPQRYLIGDGAGRQAWAGSRCRIAGRPPRQALESGAWHSADATVRSRRSRGPRRPARPAR